MTFVMINMNTPLGEARLKSMRETWPGDFSENVTRVVGRRIKLRADTKKSAGRRGCARSHQLCAEIPNVTIIEDDIRIHGGVEALECWNTKIVPFLTRANADTVYGGMPADPKKRLRNAEVIDFGCTCAVRHLLVESDSAAGFIMYRHLSKKSASIMLGANLEDCVVDTWFAGQAHANGLKTYCVAPFIAKPVAGVSCISQAPGDYSGSADRGEASFLKRCLAATPSDTLTFPQQVHIHKTLLSGAKTKFGGRV